MGEIMKTTVERLYDILSRYTATEVRSAYILRVKDENNRIDFSRNWLLSNGYEEVDASGSNLLLSDGRPVSRINGKAYALKIEEYVRRRDIMFAENEKRAKLAKETRQTGEATEAIAGKLCKCGGSLYKTRMCTACQLGQLGYKYRYTCDSCEMDIASKEEFDT